MKYDAAFEALKRANPEPDPAALRRNLTERTTTDLIDAANLASTPRANLSPRRRRNRVPSRHWRPALAGGFAVLTVVVTMLVPWTGGQSLLDSIRWNPIAIATRYMDARNAFDAAAANELLADDALLRDVPRFEREELELGFEALRVYGWQLEPFACENTPGTTLVTCNYLMDTRLSQIVRHPPIEGRILFLVEDGEIRSLVHDFNLEVFAPECSRPLHRLAQPRAPGHFRPALRSD